MPVADTQEYQDKRSRLKSAIDDASATLEDIVFEMSVRLGERQSYSYVEAVLNGRSTSEPMLDRLEGQLHAMGILED